MSKSSDELREISVRFERLADRVYQVGTRRLPPEFTLDARMCIRELERHFISVLDPPYNMIEARSYYQGAQDHFHRKDLRRALQQCFMGLSKSLHDLELYYMASLVLQARGEIRLAAIFLEHVLWINPSDELARSELDALKASPEYRESSGPMNLFDNPPSE